MARVQILSKEEQKIFATPPQFNSVQQEYYFKLPKALQEYLHNCPNLTPLITPSISLSSKSNISMSKQF